MTSMSRRELLLGRKRLDDIADDETGATAIEYGLVAGLIGVVLVGSLTRLGKRQRRNYNCVKRAMKGKAANKFCSRRGA